MGSTASSGLTVAAAVLVAVAGIARLRDADVDRRLLGGVLLAVALAALAGVARVPQPAAGPGPLGPVGLGGAIVHALLVTTAASAGFAFLRRVTQDPAMLRWSLRAVTAGVGLLQVLVLVVVASRPTQPVGVAAAVLVTAVWPGVTTVLGASVLRTLGAAAPRPLRVGLALALAGCAIIGAGSALGAVAAAADPPGVPLAPAVAVVSGAVGASGLLLLGAGVVVPGTVARVGAAYHWVAAVRVLRRARPLVSSLAEVAGEWAPSWGAGRSPLRLPVEQAYSVLIFVRDAAFMLRPFVGVDEHAAARAHARRHGARDAATTEALAEACWLALAITRRRAGRPAVDEQDSVFLENTAAAPAASVSAELACLEALATAWARTSVVAAFVDMMTVDAPLQP
jgi:hypothetical protein